MKKKFLLLLFAVLFCSLAVPTQAKTVTVKSKKAKIYLSKNQVRKLRIRGSSKTLRWKSKNKKVVKVTKKCNIKGLKVGKAVVYTKYKKKTYKCTVVVMALNKKSVSLKTGTSAKIKLRNGGKKVTWTSSDTSVATVKNGKITAVGEGKAVIKAIAHGKTYKCKVVVPTVRFAKTTLVLPPQPVISTEITTPDSSVATAAAASVPESSATATLKITTRNFKKAPKFASSNTTVATVSSDGIITALKNGTTIITVSGDGLVFKEVITVSSRPVDTFLNYLNKYNTYVKKNAQYFKRSDTPEESFADVKALVAKKSVARINCRAGISWAFYDMGITTGKNNSSNSIWATNGSFKGKYAGSKTVPSNIQNYLTRITQGRVIGMNFKEAVDAGLLRPGDICTFKGRTHTFTYSGKGYEFYDGGTITEMAGYSKVGFLLDYSADPAVKYNTEKTISEILRWK